jgi:hypothetical protein
MAQEKDQIKKDQKGSRIKKGSGSEKIFQPFFSAFEEKNGG